MAVYVLIRKTKDTSASAEYRFGPNEDSTGLLSIDKVTGRTTLLDGVPGDTRNMAYFRAAVKVIEHWERGELPEELCWAS